MKMLTIIFFFISFNAKSLMLSSARSVPEGTSIQSFIFEEKVLNYKKRSNFFDLKKDLRIGVFQLEISTSVLVLKKQIESVLADVKQVDQFLQVRGSSFNKLSGPIHHESVFYLNDFVIKSNSIHYLKLKESFDRLQALPYKQISGIELIKDTKQFSIIEKGPVSKKELFNMSFYCEKASLPTVCGYKDVGILYLE